MAFKHLVAPWTFGGALVLGYATFAWLRGKRGKSPQVAKPDPASTAYELAPLSDQLEHVPEELALTPDPEGALPANTNGGSRPTDLGASFLGRAAFALSPFSHPAGCETRNKRGPEASR